MSVALRSAGFSLGFSALALGCAAGLIHAISVVGFQIPFDPNEGWNAYFAQLAARTGSPYPPAGGLLVNNYPPLSFYLIGEISRLTGDAIITGRLISLLALGVLSYGILRAARLMGCSTRKASFAALLFIACLLLTSDYVAMDDPQLLGHAVAIWGLVAVLRAPSSRRSMVIAPLLLTIAFFIKHNLVLLPLTLALWLMLANRRSAFTFVAAGTVFLLIGLGLFRDAFGTDLFRQLASSRTYSLANVASALVNWLPWAAVPLCGAFTLYLIARRERDARLALIYAVAAIVGGLLFSSGAGVDANAMFDADIALVLCAALLLDRLDRELWIVVAAILYVVPLGLLLRNVDGDWTNFPYWLHPMADERREATSEILLLRSSPEPVLCEMLSLCYWAGKTAEVDVFNIDQRIRADIRSEVPLVRMIETRRFAMVELEVLKPFPIAGEAEQALMRNYEIVRRDDERVFLSPR
jgi:hypothetical protein